jgi:arylsulfatase
LLDLAGAPPPSGLDGISFAPTLLGHGEQRSHEFLYWELASYSGQQALRAGDWKAVLRDRSKGNDHLELYDLATDPGEQHDLAPARPDVVAELRRLFASI